MKSINKRKQFLEVMKGQILGRRQDSLHRETAISVEFVGEGKVVRRSVTSDLSVVQDWVVSVAGGEEVPVEEETVVELYDRADIGGQLLILGAPGSGKTTMLLELGKELLERAERSEGDGVPVIFELTGWGKSDNKDLGEWMVEEMQEQFGVPRGVGRVWVKDGGIVPLLDGLDELGLVGKRECVWAIDAYVWRNVRRRVVVCCRQREYGAEKVVLDSVRGAVRLEPLSDEKIRGYLEVLGRSGLWPLLEGNGELLELVRAPFFLSIFVTAYRGKRISTQADLLEAYIQQQLENSGGYGAFGRWETRHWLMVLAQQNAEGTNHDVYGGGNTALVLVGSEGR